MSIAYSQATRKQKATTDRTWGIERHPKNDAVGELVVPVIMLWNEPGVTVATGTARQLTGALSHDFPVSVIEERVVNGLKWCKVRADVEHKGRTYPQKGWLRASLLFKAGAAELRKLDD